MKKYIYKITNIVNNKCYIGQAKNYKQRFQQHISALRKNKHENQYLQYSWNFYGEENFKFEVIDCTENYNEMEKYYISLLDSTNIKKGYNILPGGENPPVGSHATLTEYEVGQIKQMLKEQLSFKCISEKFQNVSIGQIRRINSGKCWYDETLKYPLKKNNDDEIGIDIANNIMNDLLNSFLTQKEIAKKYNVARTCVTAINQGDVELYYNSNFNYPLRKGRCVGNICDNPQVVDEIITDLMESNLSIKNISEKYNVCQTTVYDINKGRGRYFRDYISYPIRNTK